MDGGTTGTMIRSSLPKAFLAAAVLGLAILFAFAASPAVAQAPAGPIPPKPGGQFQPPPETPTIRVKVDLVNTPVIVSNAAGEMVLDLTRKDFRIFDNDVEQTIEDLDVGGAPLSVAILLQRSSRIEALLPAIRQTGILFTQIVLGAEGDATVIGYDDQVVRLLDFTADHMAIEKTFADLEQGTSGARLYDALSLAVGALRNRPPSRRRVIITVAEAVDSGSESKLGQVLREAQLANITIYSVGLSPTAAALRRAPEQPGPPSATPPGTFGRTPIPGTLQTPTTEQQRSGNIDLLALTEWLVQNVTASVGDDPLEIATVATGGLHQSTFRDRSIETAIDHIGGELHAQYTLSYRPSGTAPDGYHEIKVLVDRPGLKVRSRPGYYLSPPGA